MVLLFHHKVLRQKKEKGFIAEEFVVVFVAKFGFVKGFIDGEIIWCFSLLFPSSNKER